MAQAGVWLLLLLYLTFGVSGSWFGSNRSLPDIAASVLDLALSPPVLAAWACLLCYLPLRLITSRMIRRGQPGPFPLFLLLAAESQLMTLLLFFTGGATNPLIFSYLILLMMAALGLPSPMVAGLSLMAVVDYSLLNLWYHPLLVSGDALLGHHTAFDWHLTGMWMTFVVSVILLAAVVPNLVQSRQRQSAEVQRLREQQLKHEQLIGIGTLAANTAHEMGTPLMTMKLLLDGLETHIKEASIDETSTKPTTGPVPDELHQDIDLLQQQVALCQSALTRLSEQGKLTHRDPVRGSKQESSIWLNQQLARWRLSHPKAIWQWQHSTEPKSVWIPASPLLDQALINLLDNAAEAGNQAIQLSVQVLADQTSHDWSHSGIWRLDILQPDSQASSALTEYQLLESQKPSGLGMGFYLSNASVEQFGGTIELNPTASGGSLCRLQLPAHIETKKSP
jgi:two-component system sensor histidine kinase RegB